MHLFSAYFFQMRSVRIVCNSDIDSEDAKTAKAAQQTPRRSWCEGNPEKFGESSNTALFAGCL